MKRSIQSRIPDDLANNAKAMHIPDYVRFVIERLKNNGYEAFLVGGCVRDGIMGKPPKDYDIASSALPEQILACFSDCHTLDNGIKHGTVGVVFGKECVEITTYRVDGEYTDCRHPDSVTFSGNLRDDLSRRDFTMNAVAFDEIAGYIDQFGGADDIKNGVIRCVGDPMLRFSEDALRIMRALRFSSVLGFNVEKSTAEAPSIAGTGISPLESSALTKTSISSRMLWLFTSTGIAVGTVKSLLPLAALCS